jgi:putative DNA primase/helicase
MSNETATNLLDRIAGQGSTRITFHSFTSIQSKPIAWIWEGYLAEGKLTSLPGEPGDGKSLISVDLAARVATGRDFPDGSKNILGPADVLILTEEEDPEDTIKPRYLAAGGDPSKIHMVKVNEGDSLFALEDHLKELAEKIKSEKWNIKLIIFDPIVDYTKGQANVDKEVRPALNKLGQFAREMMLSVISIIHLNKKSDMAAIHRVGGARAWVSVPRFNFLVGKGEDGTRHMVTLKNNLSEDKGSLDFEIELSGIISDEGVVVGKHPRIKWLGKGTMTAAELTQPPKTTRSNSSGVKEWLKETLNGQGWVAKQDIVELGKAKGYSESQLENAKTRLNIIHRLTNTVPATAEWSL